MSKVLVTSLALLLLLALIAFLFLSLPSDTAKEKRRVLIPRGLPYAQVVKVLQGEGLLRYPRLFYLYGRVTGAEKRVEAGEYLLSSSLRPQEITRRLLKGEVITYRVTIPEGFTVRQIASLLKQRGIIEDEEEFCRLAFDPRFVRSLGIEDRTLEGYLFPDTYCFPRGTPPGR